MLHLRCGLEKTPVPICGLHLCYSCKFPLPEARCSLCFSAFHINCVKRCQTHSTTGRVLQINPKTGMVEGTGQDVLDQSGALVVEQVVLDLSDFTDGLAMMVTDATIQEVAQILHKHAKEDFTGSDDKLHEP